MLEYLKSHSILSINDIKALLIKYDEIIYSCECGSLNDTLPCICPEEDESRVFRNIYENMINVLEYYSINDVIKKELNELKK